MEAVNPVSTAILPNCLILPALKPVSSANSLLAVSSGLFSPDLEALVQSQFQANLSHDALPPESQFFSFRRVNDWKNGRSPTLSLSQFHTIRL